MALTYDEDLGPMLPAPTPLQLPAGTPGFQSPQGTGGYNFERSGTMPAVQQSPGFDPAIHELAGGGGAAPQTTGIDLLVQLIQKLGAKLPDPYDMGQSMAALNGAPAAMLGGAQPYNPAMPNGMTTPMPVDVNAIIQFLTGGGGQQPQLPAGGYAGGRGPGVAPATLQGGGGGGVAAPAVNPASPISDVMAPVPAPASQRPGGPVSAERFPARRPDTRSDSEAPAPAKKKAKKKSSSSSRREEPKKESREEMLARRRKKFGQGRSLTDQTRN